MVPNAAYNLFVRVEFCELTDFTFEHLVFVVWGTTRPNI